MVQLIMVCFVWDEARKEGASGSLQEGKGRHVLVQSEVKVLVRWATVLVKGFSINYLI